VPLPLTFTPDRNSATILVQETCDVTDGDAAELFSKYRLGVKDGPAFIPAILEDCPAQCRNVGHKGSICGGNSPHRLSVNVRAMTALALDFDKMSVETAQSVIAALQLSGKRMWFYESFSSNAATNDCRFRVVIPFAEPIPIASPEDWSDRIWPALVAELGPVVGSVESIQACKDPARLYYMPAKKDAGQDRDAAEFPGEIWSPKISPSPAVPGADPGSLRPRETAAPGGNLEKARAFGLTMPVSRADGEASKRLVAFIVQACMGFSLSEAEALVLCEEFSQRCTTADGKPYPWETAELERAIGNAYAKHADAMGKTLFLADVKEELRVAPLSGKKSRGATNSTRTAGATNGEIETIDPDGVDWESRLIRRWKDDNQTQLIAVPSPANVGVILEYSEEWRGVFRKNAVGQEIEMWGGPLVPPDQNGLPRHRAMLDTDDTEIANWLRRSKWKQDVSDNQTRAQLAAVAVRHAYDPAKDELLARPAWDGVERLDTMLIKAFGAEDTHFNRLVSKKFFIAMVARRMEPGCKVDTALVLEGEQGTLKTSAIELLGGAFFTDERLTIGTKDTAELISKRCVIELTELGFLKKHELAEIKAFISKREDAFRPSYGYRTQKFPRRCVFIGSTNEDQYLEDTTGNRRWWCVRISVIDLRWLRANVDQLWAEALVAYNAKATCPDCTEVASRCSAHRWWLAGALEEAEAAAVTEQRMVSDSLAEVVAKWFLSKDKAARPGFIQASDVCAIIGEPVTRINERRIATALKRVGFKYARKDLGGKFGRVYLAPKEILESEKDSSVPYTKAASYRN
jgi:predicted P-loop ATPase